MKRDEIQAKLAELKTELQEIGNQLLAQSPVACKILGKMEAYRELLDNEEQPPDA